PASFVALREWCSDDETLTGVVLRSHFPFGACARSASCARTYAPQTSLARTARARALPQVPAGAGTHRCDRKRLQKARKVPTELSPGEQQWGLTSSSDSSSSSSDSFFFCFFFFSLYVM
ncbi:hypothetical protein SK128_023077, partial [Halocaridina rubra]